MFQFNKKLKRLDIPAKDVLRMHRSLSDVQVALPGLTAQRATAYVCAFSTEHGLRVAIAFHLRDTNSVVYYLNGGGNLTRKEIGTVLQEGVVFAETLGFMLSDLDIHQMETKKRNDLWDSLPLKSQPKPIAPETPAVETKPVDKQSVISAKSTTKALKVDEAAEVVTAHQSSQDDDDIDLGLPRASALSSMRRKKAPPTAEELEEKRRRLRDNLGRFLSSM